MFSSGPFYHEFFCSRGLTCDPLSQCADADECQVFTRRQGIFGAYFSYSEKCSDAGACAFHVCSEATQTGLQMALDAGSENSRHCLHQHWYIRVALIVLFIFFFMVLLACCVYFCCCRMPSLGSKEMRSAYERPSQFSYPQYARAPPPPPRSARRERSERRVYTNWVV